MTARLAWIVAPLVLAGLHGCAPRGGQSEGNSTPVPEVPAVTRVAITGTVSYRERIALPPTAVLKVQLVDVSRADAPAVVIGEQLISSGGRQVPFAFDIAYDSTKIEPNHSYAVQARIEVDGELRFINDQRYAVITRGSPVHVEMVLKSVATTQR